MSGSPTPTVHASAVLVGRRAVLIRGPAGAGKSRLALALLQAADAGILRFARLVADDRAHLDAAHGRLLVRPAPALAGLIEVRGLGIRQVPFEPVAVVGLVLDLAADDGARLPLDAARETVIAGIRLPRLPVAPGLDPLPLALALLHTAAATGRGEPEGTAAPGLTE
jgi:HPr kinase/phosphorylase